MFCHITLTSESFITICALEWFLASMNAFMCCKLTRSCPSLVTGITLEQLFLSMVFQMLGLIMAHQIRFMRKWAQAFFACVRFISSVNCFMFSHISQSRESFITKRTLEWFLSSMNALMYFKFTRTSPSPVTEVTLEQLLVRLVWMFGLFMPPQFIFPRNWVWTFFACERFISCVNYFMSLHITRSRESFITKWTFKWSFSALTSLVYTINLEEEGNSLGHKSHLNNIFPVSIL